MEEGSELAETEQGEAQVTEEAVEAEPGAEEAEPVAEEAEQTAEEAEPAAEEVEQAAEEAEPAAEEAEQAAEEAEPAAEEAEPAAEEAEPAADEVEPAAEEAEPAAEEAEPVAEEAEPPAEEVEPAAEEAEPPAEEAEPLAEGAQQEVEDLSADQAEPGAEDEGLSHDGHGHSSGLPAEYADILSGSDIPPEDYAEFCEAFSLVSDGRGYIEGRDVRKLVHALVQECSSEDAVQQRMEEQGMNEDSRLGFAEAVTLVSSVYRPRSQLTDDLMSSFRVFDRNGNGYLEYDELFRAMFQIGNQALEESAKDDFENLVRLVDKNQDGRIDYSEFCQIVTMSVAELRRRLEDE